jgi:glycerol-3-phosphate dehydrogenase (NAD(P)+)
LNPMPQPKTIGVIGAGAWGTALANAGARAGNKVVLYEREAPLAVEMKKTRMSAFLPGISIEQSVSITSAAESTNAADFILLVVPTQNTRDAAQALTPILKKGTPVVACAKGIERGTRKFVTEILAETIPQCIPAILSGPSFATDVAKGLPTAVTLAAENEKLAADLSETLRSPAFRIYHTDDVRGVEVGGAVKNVFAIAAGIAIGRGLGASAHAALTTRGFSELVRFGRAFGARQETLMGLSGLGDLVLTASSSQSRNYSYGVALGQGKKAAEAAGGKLAEGSFTASVLVELARSRGLELPIAEAVNDILLEKAEIGDAIARLLARPVGAEN